MHNSNPVSTHMAGHYKLRKYQCPTSHQEVEYMAQIPYASIVGSLMYVKVCTRPNIIQAVGVVRRFMANLGKEHYKAVQWILRYLRGTSNMHLCYGSSDTYLCGYVDSDMARDFDGRRITIGYVFTVGGTIVSWILRL